MIEFRSAYSEATGHETTYQHKLQCLRCGLHFIVYSWNPEWPKILKEESQRLLARHEAGQSWEPRGTFRGRPVCPQCGNARAKRDGVPSHGFRQ